MKCCIVITLLFSSVHAQFFVQQQPNVNRNYNPWVSNSIWNQGNQQMNQRFTIRGYLLSDDPSPLPYGSQIIVTLADVSLQDAPSRPVNTFVLSGSFRFPIPYEIPYSMSQLPSDNRFGRQYAIQVRIEKDGQLLFINDQRVSIQPASTPIESINIFLRRVYSPQGPYGIFTTRMPQFNGMQNCLQAPETGPCKASIEQFYFNAQTRTCLLFYWGGCGGNGNRFPSQEDCERSCSGFRRRKMIDNVKQRFTY